MNRKNEIIDLAKNLDSIEVTFKDLNDNKDITLIFYSYSVFGKWFIDNYDIVKILNIKF